MVGTGARVRDDVLTVMHSSTYGGHSGMKHDVVNFVKLCDTCKRNESDTRLAAGLVQLLPIPEQAWTHITMDFIEGLLKSQVKMSY